MIWDFKEIKSSINATKLITLEEGNTPEIKFNYQNTEVILKREDLNPSGSWKDRGTAYKITELVTNNINEAVLFSSGNAAISFLTYANSIKTFKLNIVVSNKINPLKLKKIQELCNQSIHTLLISENPKLDAVKIAANNKCINLRASIDESILKGYWSLGFELNKHIIQDRKIGIFFPVSSGTTIVGTNIGMQLKIKQEWQMPKFFIAQTQAINPIVKLLNGLTSNSEEASLADAIIDSTALRGMQVAKIVKETNGMAFSITNFELIEAKEFIRSKLNIELSYTSLLSVASFLKAKEEGVELDKAILIASGT